MYFLRLRHRAQNAVNEKREEAKKKTKTQSRMSNALKRRRELWEKL
jgi:hypothetical protein